MRAVLSDISFTITSAKQCLWKHTLLLDTNNMQSLSKFHNGRFSAHSASGSPCPHPRGAQHPHQGWRLPNPTRGLAITAVIDESLSEDSRHRRQASSAVIWVTHSSPSCAFTTPRELWSGAAATPAKRPAALPSPSAISSRWEGSAHARLRALPGLRRGQQCWWPPAGWAPAPRSAGESRWAAPPTPQVRSMLPPHPSGIPQEPPAGFWWPENALVSVLEGLFKVARVIVHR